MAGLKPVDLDERGRLGNATGFLDACHGELSFVLSRIKSAARKYSRAIFNSLRRLSGVARLSRQPEQH
jgi:hypothetical protein